MDIGRVGSLYNRITSKSGDGKLSFIIVGGLKEKGE
jgi:hypothetical protein